MQLQSLQNPFSFYNNNPGSLVWPKLHPSQEKMIQISLQNSNNIINPMLQNAFTSPQVDVLENINIPLENNNINNSVTFNASGNNDNNNNYNSMHSSSVAPRGEGVEMKSSTNEGIQQLENELDEILNNRNINTTTMEDEFDCFRDINNNHGSKDDQSMIWWSNDSGDTTRSGSSNSWDSSTNLMQDQGMFQDYELGYTM
jgi:hypothetical protein